MYPAIEARKLSKRYRLGERQGYLTLREGVVNSLAAPGRIIQNALGRWSRRPAWRDSEFWAVRDLSFDVMPGEVVGLIGRNGAGKSTLLKLLSRVTKPTAGRAELRGQVGSLLEVGTGFHPELTGRENVYLSGAVLGMKRAEISRKFDRIVDFADVEQFIDTPVKRYSSGMYVRLAFAVAAHLETEIVLIDEVLAVGDLAFQKKCLGKIDDVAREGRTIIFVSHNMATIESLCSQALLLDHGRVRLSGTPHAVIDEYHKSIADQELGRADLSSHTGRKPGATPIMTNVRVADSRGDVGITRTGQSLTVEVEFHSRRPLRPCLGFTIKTDRGFRVCHLSDRFAGQLIGCPPLQSGAVICEIPDLPLLPGRYWLDLWLEDSTAWVPLDKVEDAVPFDVVQSDVLGTGRLPPATEGAILCHGKWWLA